MQLSMKKSMFKFLYFSNKSLKAFEAKFFHIMIKT